MIDYKEDCAESMAAGLKGTSAWRKTNAMKYPSDGPRNLQAARTLAVLSVEAANLCDGQWEILKPHYNGWANESWRAALSLATRQVGFHHRAKDLDSFISILVRQLSQSVAA